MGNKINESTNHRKLAEKIAQEIIDATTLTGVLLTFYPPIVGKYEQIPPIRAVIDSEWIHDDKSVGVENLTQDIRKMGRQYIKRILGFEMAQRNDPLYKEVNDIVIDNILGRVRNYDRENEMQRSEDLKDKHGAVGFLRDLNESKEDKSKNYREKVYRDLVKKTKWRDDSYREIDVDGVCNKINSYIEWGSSGAYFYVIPPCIEDLLTNVYGLTYSEIDRFFWDWYGEHIIYMLINKKEYLPPHIKRLNLSYLNESVDSVEKNKPYLDKVVDKLKHYTTFAASKSHVYRPFYTAQIPFTGGQRWYIEWFSGSLETGYGFKDGFKKEMRDVYGLTPEEIEYVYMKFTSYLIKEFKERQTKVHVVKD